MDVEDAFMNGAFTRLSAGVIIALVVGAVSCENGEIGLRQEAIHHGCGAYVITDPKTGATEFRWNDEITTGGLTR